METKYQKSMMSSLDEFLNEMGEKSPDLQQDLNDRQAPAKIDLATHPKKNLQVTPLPEGVQKAAEQLRKLKRQAAEVQQFQDDLLRLNDGFLIFKSGSKRFAIRMNCVMEVGRIQHLWWLNRMVRSKYGTFPLKDFKKVDLSSGTPGSIYLLIESQLGITAWAIDGVEKTEALKTCFIRPVNSFGQKTAHRGPFQQIIYENSEERRHNTSSPVYLLHADLLT